ncbi:hypothetical protein P171DRAFT_383141 [Karstenula rhodostoma CBS 690.94]|uniref:F-box domain-containing protein n=1 Tax=Karstenula rhodostoma CBS 690.94 TaxID=1392251 RepID=A0A9P4UEW9_9PLEO|nr:hypothetical protein P171DRAFT_383141 [Karstenula rhodostoma CBS 690.94]
MMAQLDNLPLELLFNVLSYCDAFNARSLPKHPLFAVAATCHRLRDNVEEYTRGLLKKHAKKSPPKSAKRAAAFVCRKEWMKYALTRCPFCFKKTVSKAILDAKMPCCRSCDRTEFPKMTMTAALRDHRLSKLDLFTPNILHPTLPPLSTGQYSVMGSEATMIATSDVLARKAHIASLLGPAKADNRRIMRSRAESHSSLIFITDIFVASTANTVVWRPMQRTLEQMPWQRSANQARNGVKNLGYYYHTKAVGILKSSGKTCAWIWRSASYQAGL